MTKEADKKAAKQAALLEAARQGDYQRLESILGQMQQLKARKKKSNPLASLRKSVSLNRVRDPVTGFTCLHHAALNGHTRCVQLILDCGAKLNALDYKGSSALHLAAWVGNLDVIRVLLKQRPAPAHGAGSIGTGGCQEEIGGRSASLSPTDQLTAADVNLCNNDNQTPLSLAAQFGHVQVARELLEAGARPELRSHQLDSPLDLAALNGRLEMVDLLLESSVPLAAELRQPRAVISVAPTARHLADGPAATAAVAAEDAGGHLRSSLAGWSSLLRGRRESTPTGKSPLQRLTTGTLSMRHQTPPELGGGSPAGRKQLAAESARRRATLTSGLGGSGGYASPPAANARVVHRASLSIYQDTSEILLDHSPMHYAARRGHAPVLGLLFAKYQANVLQVTSLGGILHELALNNHTRHIDVLKLVFKHISKKPNCLGYLSNLLELRDSHGNTVFDVLKAMNNKSALEMARSIRECADHLRALYSAHHSSVIQQYGTLARGGAAAHYSQATSGDGAQQQQQQQLQFASLRRKRPALAEVQAQSFQHHNQQQEAPAYRYAHQEAEARENCAPAAMTRSVSSLNRVSSFQHRQPQQQQREPHLLEARRHYQHQHQHASDASSDIAADSGIESEIMRPGAAHPQMVRSQTDCSHLYQAPQVVGAGHQQPPGASDGSSCGPRAAINRGYHVYEHEFYPPRLAATGGPQPAPHEEQLRQTTSLDIARAAATGGAARVAPRKQTTAQSGRASQASNGSLNNSHSYEAHLGSAHLFDRTRQAIMRDFDRMIGSELLNRDHRADIIKATGGGQRRRPDSLAGSSLQLSGVQLDMDRQGERLTVSGLVMEPQPPAPAPPPVPPAPKGPLPGARQHRPPRVVSGVEQDRAPAKPPRLSLLNRNSMGPLSLQQVTGKPASTGTKPAINCLQHTSTGLLKLAQPPADSADSGICHSPAPEVGGQQRPAVVRHLTRPLPLQIPVGPSAAQPAGSHQVTTTESSPPSPNTAQHCIEEALQMPPRHSAAPCSLESWLSRAQPRTVGQHEADYENCVGLQRQLMQRCNSLANLRLLSAEEPGVSSSCSTLSDERPPQVAANLHTCLSSSSSSDASPGATSHEEAEEDDYASSPNRSNHPSSDNSSCHSSSGACKAGAGSPKQVRKCKEFLLRVIIDDDAEAHATDQQQQLFHVNPLELKKIAVKRPQADAETNTDEELCASLDEESGCIRFSLRRRCDTSASNRSSLPAASNLSAPNRASISSKKSRLSVQPPTENNNNLTSTNEPKKAASSPQSESGDCFADKQAAMGLERWFMSSNLVGLVEYSPRLVRHGYDSVHFLNHPALMNEECLARCGISDESHQLLILEKIRTELEPVEFGAILPAETVKEMSLERFLGSIHLTHLQPLLGELPLADNWRHAVLQLSDKLPEGYRRRIEEALKHVAELEEQEVSPASSSSSKNSIKSIVSRQSRFTAALAQSPPAPREPSPPPERAVADQLAVISKPAPIKPPEPQVEISKSLVSIKAQLRPVAAARRSSTAKPEVQESPKKAHVSVKSICWPPKSNGQLWSAAAPVEPVSRDQPAQANNNNNNNASNKPKPGKPAPPAKPPQLVVPKARLLDQTSS